MNYFNKKVAITGSTGFIGRDLAVALEAVGARVHPLYGDVRDPATFEELDHRFDYLFHFGAPSSQVLFKRTPAYCEAVTLQGFENAAQACELNGIKLVFPSTGLLSSPHRNEYAQAKFMCERLAEVEHPDLDYLALRIFATYGPGEGHKRDFASVPYLFARDVLRGRKPVIFGDGSQVRDFIFIDDVIAAILVLAEECNDKIIDIGSGKSHSFNEVLFYLGEILERNIEPVFVKKPGGYVDETKADTKKLHKFYVPKVSFKQGLERMVFHEESDRYYNN